MYSRSAAAAAGPPVSMRRLTFAVLGTPADLPPRAIRDALGRQAQAARTAGYRDAAVAFETARGYLARAVRESQRAEGGGEVVNPRDHDQLLAAALDQVRRGYALLPRQRPRPLRAPVAPPDPALIDDPAALLDDLRALCEWAGASPRIIADRGSRRRMRVSEEEVRATVRDGSFPDPSVTEVIARGCALPEDLCCAWIAARHRAARALLYERRRPAPTPSDEADWAQAALDPLGVRSPAQLAVLLAELKERCGLGYAEMIAAAKQADCAVSRERLWAVGARYAFPSPRVLEAFLAGCGIDPAGREAWRQARKRVAGGHGRVQHTVYAELVREQQQGDLPPDPRGAQTWAQFSIVLHGLVQWSGMSVAEIAREAITAGVPVTTDALRHVLVYRALPSTGTLDAFTAGCGLSNVQQFQWRITRARLAAAAPEARRLPPRAARASTTRVG